jgi:predicted alpha/beta-fold hydrolase
MRFVSCPVCGAKVRKNQLAAHHAAVHRRRKAMKWKGLALAASAIIIVVVAASAMIYLMRNSGDGGTEVVPETDPNAVPVQFQTEDGWTIHGTFYRGDASSPLLILVHGLNEDRQAYGYLVPELRAKGYNILAYDSRGHGQSILKDGSTRKWTDFTEQDFKDMVNDLYSAKYYALSNFTTAPSVAIIGASIGANEALTFACQTNSQNNKALVLLAPGTNYHGIYSAPAVEALNQQGASVHIFFGAAQEDEAGSAAAAQSLNSSYNGPKQLEIIPGPRHGTQLLTDPPFRTKVADFLADAFSA